MEISVRLKDFLAEAGDGKLQQLKLACKELGITLKLPAGAYTHDEMVGRVVDAMNAAFKKDGAQGIHRLSSSLFSIKALDVPKSSAWYPLAAIQTDVPDTLWSTDLLAPLAKAYSTINAYADEVRDAAKIYLIVFEALYQISQVARGRVATIDKDQAAYTMSVAKANIKSLGLRLEAN